MAKVNNLDMAYWSMLFVPYQSNKIQFDYLPNKFSPKPDMERIEMIAIKMGTLYHNSNGKRVIKDWGVRQSDDEELEIILSKGKRPRKKKNPMRVDNNDDCVSLVPVKVTLNKAEPSITVEDSEASVYEPVPITLNEDPSVIKVQEWSSSLEL